MVSIISGSYSAPTLPLSSTENETFDEAWDAFSTLYDRFSQGALSSILGPYKSLYKAAVEMGKAQFKGTTFGGLMYNAGFNMQMIRAVTVLTQNNSTPVYKWARTFTTTGWQAYFGDHSSPYVTGIANGSTNSATYTLDRVNLFVTHLLSHQKPLADEMQFGVGSTEYNVFPITYERISDVYVMPLPAPMFMPLNSTYYFKANIQRLGVDDTQLLGAALVNSQYALNE